MKPLNIRPLAAFVFEFKMIDEVAREVALTRSALPECLHVPIAAVDEAAIARYIGDVIGVFGRRSTRKALLVRTRTVLCPDDRFPIWGLEASAILRSELQVWVDVAYTRYRWAYCCAFPEEALGDKVLSHAMNRRVATLKGFQYVRITPTSRRANSSSRFSEDWGVALHRASTRTASEWRRGAFIQYADLSELMLMLDMNLGGGVMDAVNEGQRLVRPLPQPATSRQLG
ncbi:MAG: hypothetical protein P4M05_21110 [Bradyrhizobium sp.]|nr:hypothetical protein [Bradyrhizobium sp.]